MRLTSEEKLIHGTLKVVNKNGLQGATTAKIAKNAGYSEAMIYKIFGNKKGLLEACYLHIKHELDQHISELIGSEKDFLKSCELLWFGHLEFFLKRPDHLSFFIQFEHSKEMTNDLRRKCETYAISTMKVFNDGIEEGFLRPMHIEVVTAIFLSPILTIAEAITMGRIEDKDPSIRLLFEATMRALRH